MPTTYHAVIDEMFAQIKGVFDGFATTLLTYAPDVRWPGAAGPVKPIPDRLWVRVSMQIVTDSQASLSNVNDKRFFWTNGLVFVQLFCPRNMGASLDNGRLIAEALQNVLRKSSTSGEIWYRNAKIVELPETVDNYPITVSAQLMYKTIST